MIKEFIINDHRITFYEKGIEIEEFDSYDNFISRVFMKYDTLKELIKIYEKK